MNTDTKVVRLRQPDEIDDPLTDVLRAGARRLLAQAIELEADAFLADMRNLKLPDGRARLVRHGHGPEREIQTGIGPVPVSRVRIRDRGATTVVDRVRFSSSILPKWARRTRSLDALLPVLYLRGVSTGDFQDALAALLGCDAPNLSPSVIARLTAEWQAEYVRAGARPLGPALRLCVGRRRLPPGQNGGARGMHARPDRRDAGEQEGTRRFPGGSPGERPKLARVAHRGEAARARHRAGDRGGRRRARLLEGARRDLSGHPAPALLAAQDCQRAEQGRQIRATGHEGRPARDPWRADPGGSRRRGRRLRREVRGEIPASCRVPDKGSGRAAGLLRLPGRTL